MSVELLFPLVALALVDSTSFGTLLIPVWLMLAPGRLRVSRILTFLGTVGVFYLMLGVMLLAGISSVTGAAGILSRPTLQSLQLVVGIVLMVLGVTIEPWTKEGKEKRAARRAAGRGRMDRGRLHRWRQRAVSGDGSLGALLVLALSATAIEAASMLPYLAAIGILNAAELPTWESIGVLAGYCAIMITPALALTAARLGFQERVTPVLERVEAWLSRNSGELTAWLLFLVGLFLTSDAVGKLFVVP